MSKVQMLRAFVNRRLTAAAEEILVLFERMIAEYEEEIDRQRRLLQDGHGGKPEIRADKAVYSANVKKLMVIKEVSPEQQERSSSLDQKDPDSPHIKEEQEELRTSQEREQLKEADVTEFTFPLKSEGDGEKPQSSQLHQRQTEQMETEADREDWGGSEPARNLDPDRHLQPASNKTSNSSETEDSNDGWKQPRELQSSLNALNNTQVPVSDVGYNAAKKSCSCSGCGKRFGSKDHLQIHMKCHTGEKTFTCPFCGKKFTKRSNLTTHLRVHTGEKPFTCSVCNTSFSLRCTLVNHMRVHTGEKPFSCSVCSKRFSKKANLNTHMALHTEEKPFKCRICDKRFTWHSQVKNHKCVVDSSG
ncbi:zinc finger protein 13-like [Thunnus maccoyii]|uniref:zinc finger protein 13-like n=1 Tax=Thunnus maccoyii TaxID=8240 RepID=UPI001C4DC897|nr:zinc finger protein 13-like [Thunnus maccoyii]